MEGSQSLFYFPAVAEGILQSSSAPFGWMSVGVDVGEPGPEWLRVRAGKEWHTGPEAEVNTSLWGLPLLLGGDLNALVVVVTSDGGKSPSFLQFLPSFQEVVP